MPHRSMVAGLLAAVFAVAGCGGSSSSSSNTTSRPAPAGFHSNINVVGESAQGLSDADVVARQELRSLKAAAPHAHAFSAAAR